MNAWSLNWKVIGRRRGGEASGKWNGERRMESGGKMGGGRCMGADWALERRVLGLESGVKSARSSWRVLLLVVAPIK